MVKALRSTTRITQGGRIVIPSEVRHRLGLEVGSEVVVSVEDDHAVLMDAKAARKKARERISSYLPKGVSLSEELMAERKAEATRE